LRESGGDSRAIKGIGAKNLGRPSLAGAVERRGRPGVRFRAIGFEPAFHKWKGRRCGGVQVHATDAARFKPVATYLALLAEARRQAPRHFKWRKPPYEFEWKKLPIDLLGG